MPKTAIKIVLTEAQLAELRLRFPEAKTATETVYRALSVEPPSHGGARLRAGRNTMEYRVIDHNPMSFRSEPAHDQNLIVATGKNKQQVITQARNNYPHVPKTTLHLERRGVSGKWEAAGTFEVGK